ncbi:MAG: ribosome assembly cofactor RimP [Marinifilaceae bacterium]|jgi:ribosome maturation factor RimP|nr:ribosome assembly cofactor RimP [Marinifilaceae bacterium]
MIERNTLKEITENILKDTELYLVDIKVSTSNDISISIDSMQGVNIGTCAEISRKIESHLDREVEDFKLEVASAGIGQSFKVIQQYHKNLNKQVEILSADGKKYKGELVEVDDQVGIKIEFEEKIKLEGKKRKELIRKELEFKFEEIKEIKDIIVF